MRSSTAEPDHRPQGGKPGDPLEPPRHKFHRQVAEGRRGSLQAAKSALIDGDAVAFRPDGLFNGEGLRQRPLEKRRDALLRLVGVVDSILFSDALVADGALVFAPSSKVARNQRDH